LLIIYHILLEAASSNPRPANDFRIFIPYPKGAEGSRLKCGSDPSFGFDHSILNGIHRKKNAFSILDQQKWRCSLA
jgi:hypothetical protein